MLNPGWATYLLCDLRKSLTFSKLLRPEASKPFQEGCETRQDGCMCLTHGVCSKTGIVLSKASIIVIRTHAILSGKNNKTVPISHPPKILQGVLSRPLQNKIPQSYGGVFPKHGLRITKVVDEGVAAIQKENPERGMVGYEKRLLPPLSLPFP